MGASRSEFGNRFRGLGHSEGVNQPLTTPLRQVKFPD